MDGINKKCLSIYIYIFIYIERMLCMNSVYDSFVVVVDRFLRQIADRGGSNNEDVDWYIYRLSYAPVVIVRKVNSVFQ